MDTSSARARQVDEGLIKARRSYAAAQLLFTLGRNKQAVKKAYQASLQCGEAAMAVEGCDPKTQWGAWIQFGYLFLCHAKVAPGLGRMADVLQGRIPGACAPDSEWQATAETALSHTRNILEYFGCYVRTRGRSGRKRLNARFG